MSSAAEVVARKGGYRTAETSLELLETSLELHSTSLRNSPLENHMESCEFYKVLRSSKNVLEICSSLSKSIELPTRFYRVLQSSTEFYKVLQGSTSA